ncbi:MAG: tyrosine-protein phosphatase [Lactobacillus sp.]|nr:tyrosine-protein phosphatase [Lactobacillus sp.]
MEILPLEKVNNARTLTGYSGPFGTVKADRLIRTGKLSQMTELDEAILLSHNLRTVIDLRCPGEADKCPDPAMEDVEYLAAPLSTKEQTAESIKEQFAKYEKDPYAALDLMIKRYRNHLRNGQAGFKKVFKKLTEQTEGATIIHCSEGKDRTGLVCMLLLHALGIDEETIRRDYLLSQELMADYRYQRDQEHRDASLSVRANVRVLGSVSDVFYDTAMLELENNFGGVMNYLKNNLDVDVEALRANYLEK